MHATSVRQLAAERRFTFWVSRSISIPQVHRGEILDLWSAAGFEILDMGSYNSYRATSCGWLSGMIRHNATFIAAYDRMDHALTAMAPALATNHFVVARKR